MRVVNASPLIHLARVSLLHLLREPRGSVEVVVPEIVLDEVMRGASHDPSSRLVEAATRDWLKIVPTPTAHPAIQQTMIDAGEIAVLSVALRFAGPVVVLEDLRARADAVRLKIPRIGTLRLLLDAKTLGIIRSVRDPLDRLRQQGMRLSAAVWEEVLKEAGE